MYGCADPMKVENLPSPYVKTGELYYFARMIDKIRLHAGNLLPADYQQVLGLGFDGRTCRFLRVDYKEFSERVLQGGTDEELLRWCFTRGRTPTNEEISMWNDWVRKKGWRGETSARLKKRLAESGFQDRTDIETMFDYLDLDEGRDPRHRTWDYTENTNERRNDSGGSARALCFGRHIPRFLIERRSLPSGTPRSREQLFRSAF